MPLFFTRYMRCLATLCAALVLASALSTPSFAQQSETDFEAPLIEHDPLQYSASDSKQLFTAEVTDNVELLAVRLFYRIEGDTDYLTEEMNPVADSSLYRVQIPIENTSSLTVQYYLQAEDLAGNVVLKGYAFAPLERTLSIDESAKTQTTEDVSAIAEKPKSNVLYYVLGALAVGALAALAGGGSGGGGGGGNGVTPTLEPCGDQGCPLTFTLGAP